MGREHNNYIQFLTYPWGQICWTLGIGVPLILLLVGTFRRKSIS